MRSNKWVFSLQQSTSSSRLRVARDGYGFVSGVLCAKFLLKSCSFSIQSQFHKCWLQWKVAKMISCDLQHCHGIYLIFRDKSDDFPFLLNNVGVKMSPIILESSKVRWKNEIFSPLLSWVISFPIFLKLFLNCAAILWQIYQYGRAVNPSNKMVPKDMLRPCLPPLCRGWGGIQGRGEPWAWVGWPITGRRGSREWRNRHDSVPCVELNKSATWPQKMWDGAGGKALGMSREKWV